MRISLTMLRRSWITLYNTVLDRLLYHGQRNSPELLRQWILHQDNAWSHMAALVQKWLEHHNTEMVKHPPYSPDMEPCNSWLVPSLKCELHGRHFEIDAHVIQETQTIFECIPQEEFETII